MSLSPIAKVRSSIISVPLITAIIVALCVLLYWQSGQIQKQQEWIDHSYQVKLEVEGLNRSLREAESTQRAMLLTGSGEAQLQEDFALLLKSVMTHYEKLKVLVSDNPDQSKLVEDVYESLTKRLEMLDKNARDLINMDQVERSARILVGVKLTKEVEDGFEKIRDAEKKLLTIRSMELRASATRLLLFATCGSALGLGVMLLSVYQENKNRKQRAIYQSRLSDARDTALDSVQATSIFVASVSHEIRTPMNGVLGAADLLQQDRRLDRGQRELVETIRYSGEALLNLINDILDLSKLQAGKMDFHSEDFYLTEILDETLNLFSDAAGRKHLELAYRIDPDVPKHLRGDARRLRQVLVNLVGNAVKFTERGSVYVEVGQRIQNGEAPVFRFQVIDTGPGISLEEQKQLFVPFSQVNAALSRRHSGTGLGLAISREIVQRLGGSMGLESSPGSGSTFWFTALFEVAQMQEDAHERLCNGGTLLLVEGRDLTSESITQHVQTWGMQVVSVPDLHSLKTLPTISGLAVIVIGQPLGASWKDVTEQLAKRNDAKGQPWFLLSYPHEQPSADLLAANRIKACLRFPFRPSDLYDLLVNDRVNSETDVEEVPMPVGRVLLVEDNPINQRIFGRQLEMLGLDLVICGDGHEGVEARINGNFDVILMDCQLPTLDGFEATRQIRAWEEETGKRRIPIIAVTAHVMTGDAEACYQAGMDDYLPKPFDLVKLRRKLGPWLQSAVTNPVEEVASLEILDKEQLGNCLSGELEFDTDLIKSVFNELALRRMDMEKAMLNEDDAAWKGSAHRSVGTTSTLGFVALAAELSLAEHDDDDKAKRAACLKKIDVLISQTKEKLKAMDLLPIDS